MIAGRRSGIRIGVAMVLLALVLALASFVILLGMTSIAPTTTVTQWLIGGNLLMISILVGLIIVEVRRVLQARRQKRAASRLHVRIITLFSFVAALPAVTVAIIASITLDQGLDRWFEDRTRSIVNSSVRLAQAYVNESARNLQGVTISLASILDQAETIYNLDRTGFRDILTQQARIRGLSRADLVDGGGAIVFSADIPDAETQPPVPGDALQSARNGQPVLIPPGRSNLVGAVLSLQRIDGLYLYTVASVNADVMLSLQQMEANITEYQGLEANRRPTQIAFALLYTGLTLIVLLSAVWTGMAVADRLVRPIRQLVAAAESVADGDLDVRVQVKGSDGDLGTFAGTFNSMVERIGRQQQDLLDANTQIDERRLFTEAVLAGVTAGVIGISPEGTITIYNRSAAALFGNATSVVGQRIENMLPAFANVYRQAVESSKTTVNDVVSMRVGAMEKIYSVQVTVERHKSGQSSHVMTIDEITELVDAQRSSAWADVARRIAHEIKNPLTPIQLSAERLRRRYRKVVEDDAEVFDKCTETIIRQVGDIGRMVDEFSSFARMPKPTLERHDLRDIAREASFLIELSRSDLVVEEDRSREPLMGMFDARMMGQAIGNLIKNAAEAIDGADPKPERGRIVLRTRVSGRRLRLDVIDNGKGLPQTGRSRLLEPYMTTREKGTGLGLAIVKKIIEDHNGELTLNDAPSDFDGGRGAMISAEFPLAEVSAETANKTVSANRDMTEKAGGGRA